MKNVRPIAIPDPLWETYARMASEMGIDRDVLVAQALHVFARITGYVGGPAPAGATPAPGAVPAAGARPPGEGDGGRRDEVAERVLETAAALERAMHERTPADPSPAPPPVPAPAGAPVLYLVGEDGALDKVVKDRFLIGRGKHCDLVIDSAKVSREHAAVVREGDAYFIEDLGSSNGTWHDRVRVERRRIEDGDEYFICSEKIRCVLR